MGLRVEGQLREMEKKCKNQKNNGVSKKMQQETRAASKRNRGGGWGGARGLSVTLFVFQGGGK
jgi:hypothetical protein